MNWLRSFIGLLCIICINGTDLEVELPYGTIKGRKLTSPNARTFRAFQGIPYAAAPVGKLRFQAPQPPKSWTGVKNTIKDSNICFSVKSDNPSENEDCLYINVYTPILKNSSNETLAVMVWMYGGAFRTGNSHYSNSGPDYLIENDVVVVTFNYRVGPFGFLATEDGVIPGNAGLKDQSFALHWVHNHIALFGGDPNRVTIFGQSAGGASVGYQLLYQKNQGLFHGAILQSGSPLSTFSFMGDISARAYAFDLALHIDESINFNNSTKLLVDYLVNNVTGREIDSASTKTIVTQRPLPVIEADVEGAFLTKESYELLEAGSFIKVPTMIGTNSEEDIYAVTSIADYAAKFAKSVADHTRFIPDKGFHLKNQSDKQVVGDELYHLYFDDVADEDRLGHFVKYNSDNKYSKPVIKHADLASKYTDVYFYIFSYDGELGNWDTKVEGAEFVGHGEDEKYMWRVGGSFDNGNMSKFPAQDQVVQKRVLKLWTNFAKYLNPTPDSSSELLQNVIWPKVQFGDFEYLDIGTDLLLKKDPKSPYYDGWTRIYEKYNERPFTVF